MLSTIEGWSGNIVKTCIQLNKVMATSFLVSGHNIYDFGDQNSYIRDKESTRFNFSLKITSCSFIKVCYHL